MGSRCARESDGWGRAAVEIGARSTPCGEAQRAYEAGGGVGAARWMGALGLRVAGVDSEPRTALRNLSETQWRGRAASATADRAIVSHRPVYGMVRERGRRLTWLEMYGALSACSYEFRSSYWSSGFHVGLDGVTGGSGTGSRGHDGWKNSSSESEVGSPDPGLLRNSTFVRVESDGGTQRSFDGSLPASCTSETRGVSNPTVNCEGEVLVWSEVGKMPCVRRCRFAFERTANDFVHVGIGHLKARKYTKIFHG